MKARELWMRCQKARIMSWLNSSQVGAVLPCGDNQMVVLAMYYNGRYVEPEVFQIPNGVPADWIGPDGPVNFHHDHDHPEPEAPEQPEEGGGQEEDGTPDC